MTAAPTNGVHSSVPVESLRPPQASEDVDAAIQSYDRIAVGLSAFATALDLDPEAEKKAVQIREYARLVRAAVRYVINVDGAVLRLRPEQRERLEETDEMLDDLIDTLEWATEKKAALRGLLDADRQG